MPTESFYVPDKAYLFVMTFGWAIVGRYVRHESPLHIVVKDASHFKNAGVDYGVLANKGPGPSCEWRYEGNALLNVSHIIRAVEYKGKVNGSPIRS